MVVAPPRSGSVGTVSWTAAAVERTQRRSQVELEVVFTGDTGQCDRDRQCRAFKSGAAIRRNPLKVLPRQTSGVLPAAVRHGRERHDRETDQGSAY